MQRITYSIDKLHPSLVGHFPGNPVVPAVVLLDEMLAGLTAISPDLQIHGFKQVKFLKPVLAGEQIQIQWKSSRMGRIGFQAYRNEEMVFSGELNYEAVTP